MSKIKVDKGIPIPSHHKYPWAEMEIGDSFLTDVAARHALHTSAKQQGVKITTKQEGKNIRVWRIE